MTAWVTQVGSALARHRHHRAGLSLLEVILALTILAVASAYLAQSMHVATENAIRAERRIQAEMVAESVMNQVIAGVLPAMPVTWTAYTNPNPLGAAALLDNQSSWLYSINNLDTEVQGMICVQVTVRDATDGQALDSTVGYSINRWIIDPSLGLDTPSDAQSTDAATGSTTTRVSETGSAGGTS